MNISLVSYGCASAAGDGVSAFWQSLQQETDHGCEAVCRWDGIRGAKDLLDGGRRVNFRHALTHKLTWAWKELLNGLSGSTLNPETLGIIFASTKGCLEDFIWDASTSLQERDPLIPILEDFLRLHELRPQKSICISNACSSSHAAIYVGSMWLKHKTVSNVLVLGCDMVGSFIYKGFQSLKALTASRACPFADTRDGLQLGDGAAALLLSTEMRSDIELEGVGLDVEGYALTRPEPSGHSLIRAYRQIPTPLTPDLIIAHGTATVPNDKVEDRVFSELFGDKKEAPRITGTKWCIGHTLGASGLMDVIAACEIMKRNHVFTLGNTSSVDPSFRANYWHKSNLSREAQPVSRILISSLGFGGVHACALIGKRSHK